MCLVVSCSPLKSAERVCVPRRALTAAGFAGSVATTCRRRVRASPFQHPRAPSRSSAEMRPSRAPHCDSSRIIPSSPRFAPECLLVRDALPRDDHPRIHPDKNFPPRPSSRARNARDIDRGSIIVYFFFLCAHAIGICVCDVFFFFYGQTVSADNTTTVDDTTVDSQ